ncbi:MAG: hypothetical protein P8L47_03210, partial [Candidatus Marinamargulisbacteria bacterium]|nr:hypothetical protein [Candidatus Marinamargulisbacteria bacterium]
AEQWANRFVDTLKTATIVDRNNKLESRQTIATVKAKIQSERIPQSWKVAVCAALDKATIASNEHQKNDPIRVRPFLAQVTDSQVKQAIAGRLLRISGDNFVHDQDPILQYMNQDRGSVSLGLDAAPRWPGFANARFPDETKGSTAEYDERGD